MKEEGTRWGVLPVGRPQAGHRRSVQEARGLDHRAGQKADATGLRASGSWG